MKEGRNVISKSSKRRLIAGKLEKTEMVVYITKVAKGKFKSQTRHEIIH